MIKETDGPKNAYFERDGQRIFYTVYSLRGPPKTSEDVRVAGEALLEEVRKKLEPYPEAEIVWRTRPESHSGSWYARFATIPDLGPYDFKISLDTLGEIRESDQGFYV